MTQDSPQIQALRARYKASLDEKASTLEEHLSKLTSSALLTEVHYQDLHAELHKLAGSSGMYGYNDVAQSARDLMTLIRDQRYEQLIELLQQLRDLLREHA